jgi:hypothetical protein
VSGFQNTLLGDKYLDRSKLQNLTGEECEKRYTSSFITSGSGYGVLTPEIQQRHGMSAKNSLVDIIGGSGDLDIIKYRGEVLKYSCESVQVAHILLL